MSRRLRTTTSSSRTARLYHSPRASCARPPARGVTSVSSENAPPIDTPSGRPSSARIPSNDQPNRRARLESIRWVVSSRDWKVKPLSWSQSTPAPTLNNARAGSPAPVATAPPALKPTSSADSARARLGKATCRKRKLTKLDDLSRSLLRRSFVDQLTAHDFVLRALAAMEAAPPNARAEGEALVVVDAVHLPAAIDVLVLQIGDRRRSSSRGEVDQIDDLCAHIAVPGFCERLLGR